ncbi:hypothetical protein TWF281_005337 [Arthrobotrys megalospora]
MTPSRKFIFVIACLYSITSVFISPVQGQIKVLPAGYNPQTQICFRYSHQTAVIDQRLYVDGGIIQIDKSDTNYSNPDFFYYDLSTTYRGSVNVKQPPQITDRLRKKPSDVPSLAGGALWADSINKRLFLYGGRFTDSSPSPFELWSYDAIYDTWAAFNETRDTSGALIDVPRLYNGASAVDEAAGMAYYFGGWISSESEYGYEGRDVAVAGLLVYDMVNNNWDNQTFDRGMGRRAEGVLLYVPLGDGGWLISFGGVRVSEDGERTAVPMSEITIYNIASSRWYTQTATGKIPESRSLFCAGVASGSAPGQNGAQWPLQNIYLYGGASTSSGPGFDDVYVLSLPSFVWTKFWPDTDINSRPHQSLTCNVIQNSQMLILGGFFPFRDECDAPDQVGIHNLNLSGSNIEQTIWADFKVGLDDYHVPTAVVDSLNLTNGSPVVTFNHPDLKTLVNRAPSETRMPTRDVSPPTSGLSNHDRTIVLATTIPGGILILALLFFCIRWYRGPRAPKGATSRPRPPPVEDTYNYNLNTDIMQLPSSPVTQNPALALAPSPSIGSSTLAGSTSPGAPTEQIPVAYVLNPVGGFTPVYSSVGPASPPTTGYSQFGGGTPQGANPYNNYNSRIGSPPMELPADQPKTY